MSVFHGNGNEDAEAFLKSYRQCRGSEDDKQLAKSFVYYLGVYSDADEWFEELPEELKGSWTSIEVLFRRKWLLFISHEFANITVTTYFAAYLQTAISRSIMYGML